MKSLIAVSKHKESFTLILYDAEMLLFYAFNN